MLATVVIHADPGAVLVALGPTVAVIVTWWLGRKKVAVVDEKVTEVHTLVNATHDELTATKDELTGELRAAKEQIARLEGAVVANGATG